MKYKMLRLSVCPAVERYTPMRFKAFTYQTKAELIAAKNSMADLLLFLQDGINCMDDYSNVFIIEALPMRENSEWVEIDESDLDEYIS